MKLPSDSDYLAAIQNPRQAFSDPDLQQGQPEVMETGALAGLPRPRAGNFATVYKLLRRDQSFAVRCFTRAIPADRARRYEDIIRHLAENRLPAFVEASFLTEGIRVQGQWFPIVKMEWVQGESLAHHVEKHRESPEALFDLAAAWVDLQGDLRRVGVAHGDLQHGNVIVTPDGLRLVDYDGMFVPALAGRRSHERGHANYQHPDRDPDFFNERLDRFSAWVVWVSLVALAHEPALWERFHGGDDCLLFRKKDFVERERSPLFQALLASPHERVRTVASFLLRSLLASLPPDVPPLDGEGLASLGRPAATPGPGNKAGKLSRRARKAQPALPAPNVALEVARFMVPAPASPPELGAVPVEDRQMANGILVAGGLSLVLGLALSPAWLAGLGLSGGLGWAWARAAFHRQGGLSGRAALQASLEQTRRELAEAEALLQQRVDARTLREKEARARHAELLADLKALNRRREQSVHKVRSTHTTSFIPFADRRSKLTAQEVHARRALEAEFQVRMEELQREWEGTSSAAKAQEEALRKLQEQHIASAIAGAKLVNANLRGRSLTSRMKVRLRKQGLQTAADVSRERLRDIAFLSSKQKALLLQWRAEQELDARRTMPLELPEDRKMFLSVNWSTRRLELEQQLRQTRDELAQRTTALETHFTGLRADVAREEQAGAESLWREAAGQSGDFAREAQRLSLELKSLAASMDALGREVATARRACASLHWRREVLERDLAALDSLRFSRYLGLLLKEGPEAA